MGSRCPRRGRCSLLRAQACGCRWLARCNVERIVAQSRVLSALPWLPGWLYRCWGRLRVIASSPGLFVVTAHLAAPRDSWIDRMPLVRLALMLVIALSPTVVQGAEPADYAGSYRLEDAAAAEAARDAAVEGVVALVPGLFRGLARGRLTRAATVTEFFHFQPEGQRITIASDQSSGWSTDLVGTEIEAETHNGQKFQFSRWMEDGKMNSRARTRKGARLSLFTLQSDGRRLTVTTTLENRLLPKPLVYRTQYIRDDEPVPDTP
ncbi:MAG: hypothetical protein CL928_17840 [Deltaproteobacteria bacterium]|nr:hypothetical protein [Deltaproteobacteria bacterium]